MLAPNQTKILHYNIISPIGKGGMGEVFLAKDTKLDRRVALKVLLRDFADDDSRLLRFMREAKAASALNHPNIITIYDIGESDGTHFIATEFIDGKTLHNYIETHSLNLKSVLDIAIQIASALNEAHKAGIVHRDIKSENIMIRKSGLVKILDFGIAKLMEEPEIESKPGNFSGEDKTLIVEAPIAENSKSKTLISKFPAGSNFDKSKTSPGMIIGTANYMSPEQAAGKNVDARSDIFSFGIVLYEILSGKLPFEGKTALDVIAAILHDELKPLNAEVPDEIKQIVEKCLQKDRKNRYQTITEVLDDLNEVKQEIDFQQKLTRTVAPNKEEIKTQILQANATAQIPQSAVNQTVAVASNKKLWLIPIAVLLLATIGFFAYRALSPSKNQIESIAVLPFENKNSDADTDYLSDGLAESLIHRLSQLNNLKVSPTSSVFRYKGKQTDPQKIAAELGVDSVLVGRMVKRGENLNLSLELVEAKTDKVIWGEQYERKMSELLATQREMASEIVNKLQLKISGAETAKIERRYTDNNEAYQIYLKGRFHWNKRTKNDILKGIEYYQQAIKLDPKFALAYAGIANSYSLMPAYSYLSPNEAFPKAIEAARKANEIDSTLAESHTALAASLAIYEWNWKEAEQHFKQALELDPNNSNANYRYAINYLLPVGKTSEAVAEIKKSLELEPLSLPIGANLAAAYLYNGQNESALEQAKKTYDLDINHPTATTWLGMAYNANGKYSEAIALSKKVLQTEVSQDALYTIGYAQAKSGQRLEAEEMIKKFNELEKTQYVSSYLVAMIHTALNDKNQAFAELEKSFEKKDWDLHRLKTDPFAAPLRDDARFAAMIKRLNLE